MATRKNNTNRLNLDLTNKEMDRFLSGLGLLPDELPLSITTPISKAYDIIMSAFNAELPVEFPTMRKDKLEPIFKTEEEFRKTVINYFKRELTTRVLTTQALHPKWSIQKCADTVDCDYMPLFRQCLSFALQEIKSDTMLQKIDFGQNPFWNKELF